MHDDRAGVANRPHFKARLGAAVDRARGGGQRVAGCTPDAIERVGVRLDRAFDEPFALPIGR
jgi:hypothetical protein